MLPYGPCRRELADTLGHRYLSVAAYYMYTFGVSAFNCLDNGSQTKALEMLLISTIESVVRPLLLIVIVIVNPLEKIVLRKYNEMSKESAICLYAVTGVFINLHSAVMFIYWRIFNKATCIYCSLQM